MSLLKDGPSFIILPFPCCLALRLTPFCRCYKFCCKHILTHRNEFFLQERHPKVSWLSCRAAGLHLMGLFLDVLRGYTPSPLRSSWGCWWAMLPPETGVGPKRIFIKLTPRPLYTQGWKSLLPFTIPNHARHTVQYNSLELMQCD